MPNGGCCLCWLALGCLTTEACAALSGQYPWRQLRANQQRQQRKQQQQPPIRHMVTATSPCDLSCTAYFLPNVFPNVFPTVLLPYIVQLNFNNILFRSRTPLPIKYPSSLLSAALCWEFKPRQTGCSNEKRVNILTNIIQIEYVFEPIVAFVRSLNNTTASISHRLNLISIKTIYNIFSDRYTGVLEGRHNLSGVGRTHSVSTSRPAQTSWPISILHIYYWNCFIIFCPQKSKNFITNFYSATSK